MVYNTFRKENNIVNTNDLLKIKKAYLPGTRIQMQPPNDSEADSEASSEPCDKGTVGQVDEDGQIHITLDNGEKVIVTQDTLKRLSIDDQILEAEVVRNKQFVDKNHNREETNRDEQYY